MEKNDGYIRVRLPESLAKDFKEYAESNRTTMSSVVRNCIESVIRKNVDGA